MSNNKQTKNKRLIAILAIALVAMLCLIAKNLYQSNNSTISLVNPGKYLADPTEGDEETQIGTITVKYVNQNGESISPDETYGEGHQLGEEYNFSFKTLEGYRIDESQYPTNRRGNYTTKNQTITFVYTDYTDEVETSSDGENVTVTVLKNRDTGISKEYKLVILKKDQNNDALPGATFKVSRPNESVVRWDKDYTGNFVVGTLLMDDTDTETYTVVEDPAPNGYDGISENITLTITKEVRDNEVFASASINNVTGAAVSVDEDNQEIDLTITNQRQYNSQDYELIIKTFDRDTDQVLPGATYKVVKDGETDPMINTEDTTGTLDVGTITVASEGTEKYTITQTPPTLYDALSGDIELTITKAKDTNTFLYKVTNATNNEITGVSTTVDQDNKQIIVTVKNVKTTVYELIIKTYDKDSNEVLTGATYKVVKDGETDPMINALDSTGTLDVGPISVTSEGTEKYTITQTPPALYDALSGDIELTITKAKDSSTQKYTITNAANNEIDGVSTELNQNDKQIIVTVKNTKTPIVPPGTKDYTVYIKTVDENGNAVTGAKYSAKQGEVTVLDKVKDTTGKLKVKEITVADVGTEVYTITEDEPTEGYEALVGNVILTLTKTLDEENNKYGATAAINSVEGVTLSVNQETGEIDIIIKKKEIPPPPKEKIFDLHIDKDVKTAEVNTAGKITTVKKVGKKIVKIDIPKSKINGAVIKVTYTLTISNIGEIAGYATEITDPVPSGMVLIDDNWKLQDGKAVTDKLADKLIQPGESETIDITYSWTVTEKDVGTKYNEALITHSRNDEGVPDRTPDQVAREPIILAVTTGNRAIITIEFVIALALATGLVYVIKRNNDKE